MTPAPTHLPPHMAARVDSTSKLWRSAPHLPFPVCAPVAALTGDRDSVLSSVMAAAAASPADFLYHLAQKPSQSVGAQAGTVELCTCRPPGCPS